MVLAAIRHTPGPLIALTLLPFAVRSHTAASEPHVTTTSAEYTNLGVTGRAHVEAPPAAPLAWHGTCQGVTQWDTTIAITLHIDPTWRGPLHATGTLAFVGRYTHADLVQVGRGAIDMLGEMTEVEGIDTVWKLRLRIDYFDGARIRGAFFEQNPILEGGEQKMCDFDLRD
jgi:hypothetical protein